MSGDLLPIQTIFKGKTVASLPKESERKNCQDVGFDFCPGGTNHWSNESTMMSHVEKVIEPHIAKVKAEESLNNPWCVLLIDCWKVHKKESFLKWLKERIPRCFVLFVPAGCTSKLQPADLVLQLVFKHHVCEEFSKIITQRVVAHCRSSSERFKLDTRIQSLRGFLPEILLRSWSFLKDRPDYVRKAWSMAAVGELNLTSSMLAEVQDRGLELNAAEKLFPEVLTIVFLTEMRPWSMLMIRLTEMKYRLRVW
eukprot:TRINITY_DN34_c0_g1_i3.p1 TRINITY_DN34_c0_g1~~TRINITY_DN34_c0_g1_i3.p1  ORF type:complete len:253 (+),score=52.19 TRINITY_DN34_c0_g1_i3:2529-3287(+)